MQVLKWMLGYSERKRGAGTRQVPSRRVTIPARPPDRPAAPPPRPLRTEIFKGDGHGNPVGPMALG